MKSERTLRRLLLALMLLGIPAIAQNVRWDPPTDAAAITTQGTGFPFLVALPNVTVNFCSYPANAVPCTNFATTFNGISGSSCPNNQQVTLPTSNTCQATSDNAGNWGVYVPSGTYAYTFTSGSTTYGPYVASVGGSGGGGGGVTSYTGGSGVARTGGVAYQATDPGSLGIQQVGTGTLNIFKNANGSLRIGDVAGATNNLFLGADNSGGVGFALSDVLNNSIFSEPFGGSDNIFLTTTGSVPTLQIKNTAGVGEIDFNLTAFTGGTHFGVTSSLATFDMPVNFGGTGAFQIGGSFGLAGQCLLSTGAAVQFGACSSGTVSSVSGTANQITSTGGATPVLSLASPLKPPGNLNVTQLANGNNAVTVQRFTDTLPTGTFFQCLAAGGGTLCQIDIAGNISGNSLITTDTTSAGHYGLTQGPDFTASCAANTVCHQAGTSIGTTYTVTEPSAGPGALSVKTSTALAGAGTTEAYVPVTGNSAHIQTADATVAGAAANTIATIDGSGNTHSSGINISTVLPSIQGPSGGAYTNTLSNTGSTVMTYSNTIPASSTVLITCVGSFKFTTAVNTPEFALNFSSAPTNLLLNVELGINATTGTHTYGRQTTNGALVAASGNVASTGLYLPVTITGGVTTNGATTFTVQGAQVTNAGGSVLNVDQNGITCFVK